MRGMQAISPMANRMVPANMNQGTSPVLAHRPRQPSSMMAMPREITGTERMGSLTRVTSS